MKLKSVAANNKKKHFELTLRNGKELVYPYAELPLFPDADNKIVDLYVDREIGSEGFTFTLSGGEEFTVLVDEVLAFNRDPEYQVEKTLYALTLELQKALSSSTLSKRQLAGLLGTSLSQLERLLDQTNYKKSANSLIKALGYLSKTVEITAA